MDFLVFSTKHISGIAAELLTVLAMSLDYSVLRPNDGGDLLGRMGSIWIHVDHGNPKGAHPPQCHDFTPRK